MRKIKKCLVSYWFWLAVGVILTGISIKVAYTERGYFAYGGEYFILPLLLMFVSVIKKSVGVLKVLFENKSENNLPEVQKGKY